MTRRESRVDEVNARMPVMSVVRRAVITPSIPACTPSDQEATEIMFCGVHSQRLRGDGLVNRRSRWKRNTKRTAAHPSLKMLSRMSEVRPQNCHVVVLVELPRRLLVACVRTV